MKNYRIELISHAPEGAVAHLSKAVFEGREVSEALLFDTAYGWGDGAGLPRRLGKRSAQKVVKGLGRLLDMAKGYYAARGEACYNVIPVIKAA